MSTKPIKFPQDEQDHPYIIEWWYFNGHLQDARKRQYAFMDCFFKADPKRVGLPVVKELPFKTVHFAHELLTDVSGRKFYPHFDHVAIPSRDSFTKPLLFINYTNPLMVGGYLNMVIEETAPFEYHIKTNRLDLQLKATKPALLVGGKGYLSMHGRNTYYYSLTNMKAEGEVLAGKKVVPVTGQAWMDHQWANVKFNKDLWMWFSVQLDNKTEILCFEYSSATKPRTLQASLSYPNGKQKHATDVKFTHTGQSWTSSKTKASYPLGWRIEIPSRKVDLEVRPMMKNHEMIYGKINYWEGPMSVTGKFNGKKVGGKGFLELVGRPSRYNNVSMMRDLMKATVKVLPAELKKILR
ncbi:lipocalin family protein [Patescibacteria group bacterium]